MTDGSQLPNVSPRSFWDELAMLLVGSIVGAIAQIFLQPLPSGFLVALAVLSVASLLVLQFGKRFRQRPIRNARFWGISLTAGLTIGAMFVTYAVPGLVTVGKLPQDAAGRRLCPSSRPCRRWRHSTLPTLPTYES